MFRHILYRYWRVIYYIIRVDNCIFEIPFDLYISYTKTVNFIVELEAGKNWLRSNRLFRLLNLLLRYFRKSFIGLIVFLTTVIVTLSKLKVF